ncbi:ABC transporter permease [Caulobacter sp. 602-2]|uniref:ABC transporter permease n=1 Tax=Caulobacter sp. 602-2 TaxID=2710887 RepID=A0A6G4QX84_9CAUL|nr:ABC transporter permease [Caulobacter sp. 602-2]NGM50240.1 ABC transporter permease [Caulobacter sp. 602-2]
MVFAWDDLVSRYRRTTIGPFWITISHAATICGLAFMFAKIFKRPLDEFFVYLAAGMTCWNLIANSLGEGPVAFMRAQGLLLSYDLPASSHVFRAVAGQFLTFLHNMIVYVAALILVKNVANANTLYLIPGLVIVLTAALGWTFTLGVLGTRFRDVSPAVTAFVGVLFMLTPIFWEKSALGSAVWFFNLNPFYHLVEVIRAPMLGQIPTMTTWVGSIASALASIVIGCVSFVVSRKNLSYWI